MKHQFIQKILLLTPLILLMLYANKLSAQSFEPVAGTNYYYLTRGTWKIASIDLDTITSPVEDSNAFQYTFYVGYPYGSHNGITITQNDTTSNVVEYEFIDATQKQIVISPGTTSAQTLTIDYIDNDLFIYLASYLVNGTLYNYRFVMFKV